MWAGLRLSSFVRFVSRALPGALRLCGPLATTETGQSTVRVPHNKQPTSQPARWPCAARASPAAALPPRARTPPPSVAFGPERRPCFTHSRSGLVCDGGRSETQAAIQRADSIARHADSEARRAKEKNQEIMTNARKLVDMANSETAKAEERAQKATSEANRRRAALQVELEGRLAEAGRRADDAESKAMIRAEEHARESAKRAQLNAGASSQRQRKPWVKWLRT